MMKRYMIGLCLLAVLPAGAQDTYEDANLVTGDLNGTARYVGMGGAMDALGADLSTISTNPAGIGLYRSSQVMVSGGLTAQGGAEDFNGASKSHANLDQIGFVWAQRNLSNTFFNVAFNYHKSRDFNYILSATNRDLYRPSSQNAQSYVKAIDRRGYDGTTTYAIGEDKRHNLYGDFYWTSQLDDIYYNAFIVSNQGVVGYNTATGYDMERASKGYIGEYEINISGNISDRVYLGLTVGLQDVHYKAYGEYTDELIDRRENPVGDVTVCDSRKITGTGYNFKVGAIVRPFEYSAFRVGLSFTSPTFYDLNSSNFTYLLNNTDYEAWNPNYASEFSYDFCLNSPMKVALSLGHTIGDYLALGATYEYADYGATDPRVSEGYHDDWYCDDFYSHSLTDKVMKKHTENTLRGVSTLKLGAEYKPVKDLALRVGYNYVSPMYESDGFKDTFLDSYGTFVSTTTDYINWGETHRLTLGVGYLAKHFFADLAYQYSTQKGDFYPYMDTEGNYWKGRYDSGGVDNVGTKTKVENNRHQLIVTLGYKF